MDLLLPLALLSLAVWAGITAGIYTFRVKEESAPPSIRIPVVDFKIELPFGKREKVIVPLHERVDAGMFFPAAVNLFCFGVCLAGTATFFSSFDRYRWRTIGITVTLLILQMIAKLAGTALEELRFLKLATIFTTYEPQKIVDRAVHTPDTVWSLLLYTADGRFEQLGPLGFDLVMLGIGLAGYVAATVIFVRRDVPAPL